MRISYKKFNGYVESKLRDTDNISIGDLLSAVSDIASFRFCPYDDKAEMIYTLGQLARLKSMLDRALEEVERTSNG